MIQFLETICINNGFPQHLEWHQQRVDATMKNFYPAHKHTWQLTECIHPPEEHSSGWVRCRMVYDAHQLSIHYYPYHRKQIESLTTIDMPTSFEYRYKYADRTEIDKLYEKRQGTDDILIVDEGWIKDTTIANIAFRKGVRWYTPSLPLLAGTTWKRLVSAGILVPRPIHLRELQTFDSFKLFNALNSFETASEVSVRNIK